MAQAGYSKQNLRLGPIDVFGITVSDVSICTPAAASAYTIKHIQWTNTDTVTHYVCLSIGANTRANRIVDQVAIAANSEYSRYVMHIVGPGELLCPAADTAAKTELTIEGYLEKIG